MQYRENCDIIYTSNQESDRWAACPVCRKKIQKLLPTTTAHDLPLYCPRCKRVTTTDIFPEPEPRA